MGELKVGDKIATHREFGKGVDIHVIQSETPTMWVCRHRRFRKDSLKVVGPGRWGPYQGRIPTDADIMTSRIDVSQGRLQQIKLTAHNIDAAEAFIAAATKTAEVS